MHETERCGPNQDLRQGDIIRLEGGAKDKNPTLGIIINADCDLAHKKLDGVIAYLPIYSFQDYLERFWIGSYVANIRSGLLRRINEVCKLNQSDEDDLVRWLVDSQPSEVSKKLGEQSALKPKDQLELTDKLTQLYKCVGPDAHTFATFRHFCALDKDPLRYATKKIATAKEDMGEGHFFISEIVGETEIGFVIRMRRIYTIDADCCFPAVSNQKTNTDGQTISAARIARLTSLYQFKVAQLFAHQFSRIGLPDETTALSALAVANLAAHLSETIV